MVVAIEETRQQRRARERAEAKVKDANPKTFDEKQRFLLDLVDVLKHYTANELSSSEKKRVEEIRIGLTVDMNVLLEESRMREVDMKIEGVKAEIDVYKSGLTKKHGKEKSKGKK